jgi:salicylate 1-O-methyltransferase
MPEPSQLVTSAAGLMHDDGFYNRHGWMQAAGVTAALPALARAAAAVPIEVPLMVADYGSSQGRNSLRPMQVAIERLRARVSNVPITVIHIDQPGNDFSSLFALLNSSPDSYLNMHSENYAAAVGRSFFDPVLPPASVTLGWSSFAVMWLTRTPPEALGHVSAALVPLEVLLPLRAQGDADWRRFLAARAGELRPGGRLVVLVAGPAEREFASTRPLMQTIATTLRQLVQGGRLSEAACKRAFIPTLPRLGTELRAPFAKGAFAGLALEEQEDWPDFPDAAWERYRGDGDVGALTEAYLGFFQATFLPSLLHSLEPFDAASERQSIADTLEAEIRSAIKLDPQPFAQIPLHMITVRRL